MEHHNYYLAAYSKSVLRGKPPFSLTCFITSLVESVEGERPHHSASGHSADHCCFLFTIILSGAIKCTVTKCFIAIPKSLQKQDQYVLMSAVSAGQSNVHLFKN